MGVNGDFATCKCGRQFECGNKMPFPIPLVALPTDGKVEEEVIKLSTPSSEETIEESLENADSESQVNNTGTKKKLVTTTGYFQQESDCTSGKACLVKQERLFLP